MTEKLSETPSFNKYSSYEIEEFEDTVIDGKNFYGERAQDFTPFSGIFGTGGKLDAFT